MSQTNVRVRFAPSPTGPLHIGGVRTALFNYFFARKHGGKFILRIEDTDSQRFVPGAEEYINESLNWCGIQIDEGVQQGGPFGPYKQSERKAIYKQYADMLVDSGNAYYAFDTAEELDTLRKDAEAKGEAFTYGSKIRATLCNSLTLSADEVSKRIENGEQWVIRFKMPQDEEVVMQDIIRGEIKVNTSTLDDKVLFKSSDMLPTYHLANITDDYLMKISHVIRGEEWLPSLPLHFMLYRAFGWTDKMPQFAHLPLLLKPSGNGKLSKRDGDKLGFPVFPLEWKSPEGELSRGYREDGYIPEAFVNLLAMLGWNPGTEQEIFSMDELINLFSFERVNKSGARFDPEKAKWFNHQYLVNEPNEKIAKQFATILQSKGINFEIDKVEKIVGLVKERANLIDDLWDQASFFFESPTAYDEKTVSKFWNEETPSIMSEIANIIQTVEPYTSEAIDAAIKGYINDKGHGMGKVMNAIRLSLVGEPKGPGVADICELLGKEETVNRLRTAAKTLG